MLRPLTAQNVQNLKHNQVLSFSCTVKTDAKRTFVPFARFQLFIFENKKLKKAFTALGH